MTALFRGKLDEAGARIEEALSLFRGAHDLRGEAWALQNLAWMAFIEGEYTKAEKRLEVSAATFAEIGDWGGVSWALGLLAWVRFTQGRLEEARELAVRIHLEARELGNRWAGAMMNVLLANISLWTGDPAGAIDQARAAVEIFRGLSDPWGELQAMAPLILAMTFTGQYPKAQALIDEIETVGFQVIDETMARFPSMVRVSIAVIAGDDLAYQMAHDYLGDLGGQRFVNDEQRMLRGLACLQHGAVDEALDVLENARELALGAGSDAAATVAYALTLVAAGRPNEALAVCADAEGTLVTYADRWRHGVACAFAAAGVGDRASADATMAEILTAIDDTDATLDRALVRIAASTLWSGEPRGDVAAAEALDLLASAGTDAAGWRRLFGLLAPR